MFKNILLAVDGSGHALKAAKVAGEMARQIGASVTVVTAFDPIPNYIGEPDRQKIISAHMERAEEAMRNGVAALGEIHGALDEEIIEGPAAEAILRLAETRGIDLIVMGTRGLGQLSGMLLGSQSQKVLQHASCPVLLVR